METAVSRKNSWKTNYIIALLKMKALSLIPILVDLSSAVIPISLYINYIDMTELRSTGFHHQMLITGASCDFIRGVRQTGLYIYFILPSSYFLLLKGNETIYFFSIGKPVNLLLVPRI